MTDQPTTPPCDPDFTVTIHFLGGNHAVVFCDGYDQDVGSQWLQLVSGMDTADLKDATSLFFNKDIIEKWSVTGFKPSDRDLEMDYAKDTEEKDPLEGTAEKDTYLAHMQEIAEANEEVKESWRDDFNDKRDLIAHVHKEERERRLDLDDISRGFGARSKPTPPPNETLRETPPPPPADRILAEDSYDTTDETSDR